MRQVEFHKATIVVASGTAAGNRPDTTIQLPTEFQGCTGICAVEIRGGGISRDYDLGLVDPAGKDIFPLMNASAFGVVAPDTDVDPAFRFRDDATFAISSGDYKVKLATGSDLTAELKVQVIFRCERECK